MLLGGNEGASLVGIAALPRALFAGICFPLFLFLLLLFSSLFIIGETAFILLLFLVFFRFLIARSAGKFRVAAVRLKVRSESSEDFH